MTDSPNPGRFSETGDVVRWHGVAWRVAAWRPDEDEDGEADEAPCRSLKLERRTAAGLVLRWVDACAVEREGR